MRIVSGIQPSGKLHLGNYFGAVRQFLQLQDTADEALYFLADLHALTSTHAGETLRDNTLALAIDLFALGIDPERSIVFRQSDISEIPALAWILGAVTPVAMLERGHSYKDKVAKGLPVSGGLLTYPVLQTADIVLYGADAVPVGRDQQQHLEIARAIVQRFNSTFVPGFDAQDPVGERTGAPQVLKPPEPLIQEQTALVPGLDGQKMSKSYGNTIDLFAPDKTVRKQIMSIKTDSTPVDAPKPRPSTLLTLIELLCSPEEAREHGSSWDAGGVGYGTYKKRLVERFFELFGDARARRAELAADPEHVESRLRAGAEKAAALARPIWNEVTRVSGVAGSLVS